MKAVATNIAVYRHLQQHLDQLPIGFPTTTSGVEIEILQYFFSPAEAEVALCLSLMTSTVAAVCKRCRKRFGVERTVQEQQQMLEKMFLKGVIDRSGKQGAFRYRNAMLVIGMFEFNVDHLNKELMKLLHRYLNEAFGEEFFRATLPQLRTSPHLKAVIPEHQIATYDNMKAFVVKTQLPVQVANCVCKQGAAALGHPCKQTDNIEICLMFGAESYEARQQVRTISVEECLALLDMAEERGLVLQPGNTRDPFCICLCCGCCCGVLTTAKKFPDPARFFATNYYAAIDTADCIGCGICLKRCQMDALQLGEHKKVQVDLTRCIGCGLCVTTCPTQAARLVKKEKETVPPLNIALLYLSILKQKLGRKRMVLNMFNMLTGRPL